MAPRDRAGVAGVHAAQQDRGGQVPGVRHRPGRRPRRRGGDPRPVPPRPLGVPRLHLREQSKAGRVSGGRSSPVSSSASKFHLKICNHGEGPYRYRLLLLSHLRHY